MASNLLEKHHPHTLEAYIARGYVSIMHKFEKTFLWRDIGKRAFLLESLMAISGMVSAARLHYIALRTQSPDREKIEELLGEASNGHFHVLAYKRVVDVSWSVRFLIRENQLIYRTLYRFTFFVSQKFSHRLMGYTYEKAIDTYMDWLEELKQGLYPNRPAPQIAIQYWELSEGATLIDMVEATLNDLAVSRDRNHGYANNL